MCRGELAPMVATSGGRNRNSGGPTRTRVRAMHRVVSLSAFHNESFPRLCLNGLVGWSMLARSPANITVSLATQPRRVSYVLGLMACCNLHSPCLLRIDKFLPVACSFSIASWRSKVNWTCIVALLQINDISIRVHLHNIPRCRNERSLLVLLPRIHAQNRKGICAYLAIISNQQIYLQADFNSYQWLSDIGHQSP
jgi:hypothetical protein